MSSVNSIPEISNKYPTPIILSTLNECVNSSTSAREIFMNFASVKRICKFLCEYSGDFTNFLKINNVRNEIFIKAFNDLVRKSCFHSSCWLYPIRESVSSELAMRLKKLIDCGNIAELVNSINKLLPQFSIYHKKNLEELLAKVVDAPYYWGHQVDHYLSLVSIKCAKKDAYATAQNFHKIPLTFLDSGVKVGEECAKNNPSATLKFIDNFAKGLIVKNYGRIEGKHLNKVRDAVNLQLAKIGSEAECEKMVANGV